MTDSIEFKVDIVQERLKRVAKSIDEDVKTGKEARDLHDFVQDELLPVIGMLAEDVRTLAEIAMEHDESIAQLGPDMSTQILPEHAKEIIDFITNQNTLLEQLVATTKQAGQDATNFEQQLAVGKALIDFIESVTIEVEEDEEEEEEASEE